MGDIDSLNLSDFADIIETHFDSFEKDLDGLKTATDEVIGFFNTDTNSDEIQEYGLFQYRKENQLKFHTIIRDFETYYGHVYSVYEKINTMFKATQEKLEQQANELENRQNQSSQVPVIINNGGQESVGRRKRSWFDRLFGEKDELPDQLKDAWMISKDLQLETINIPKLSQQMIDFHDGIVVRQKYLKEGAEPWLQEEYDFFVESVLPATMQLVKSALDLAKEKNLMHIVNAYNNTLNKSLQEEQLKAFSGGGSEPPNQ